MNMRCARVRQGLRGRVTHENRTADLAMLYLHRLKTIRAYRMVLVVGYVADVDAYYCCGSFGYCFLLGGGEEEMKNLFISFSGGETSAFMTLWCWENLSSKYKDIKVLFANTGQENEETLEFVSRFSEEFSIPVVWVEAAVSEIKGKGTSHRVVNFNTASRHGEPFEAVIAKYGIPNQSYPHCTRELKLAPMTSYLSSIGWQKGEYDVSIGIRHDEIDRMNANFQENNIIYPLINRYMRPSTKPMINSFWDKQKFRLNLKGYQGNCKWCWKKSLRKHLTLMSEDPSIYDFPQRMEQEYGLAGHNMDGTERVFFRKNTSTRQLREIFDGASFIKAEDDSTIYLDSDLFSGELDLTAGCSDSCEIDFDNL